MFSQMFMLLLVSNKTIVKEDHICTSVPMETHLTFSLLFEKKGYFLWYLVTMDLWVRQRDVVWRWCLILVVGVLVSVSGWWGLLAVDKSGGPLCVAINNSVHTLSIGKHSTKSDHAVKVGHWWLVAYIRWLSSYRCTKSSARFSSSTPTPWQEHWSNLIKSYPGAKHFKNIKQMPTCGNT